MDGKDVRLIFALIGCLAIGAIGYFGKENETATLIAIVVFMIAAAYTVFLWPLGDKLIYRLTGRETHWW